MNYIYNIAKSFTSSNSTFSDRIDYELENCENLSNDMCDIEASNSLTEIEIGEIAELEVGEDINDMDVSLVLEDANNKLEDAKCQNLEINYTNLKHLSEI